MFKDQYLPPEVAKKGLVVHMRGHLSNTAVLPKYVDVVNTHIHHQDSKTKKAS